MSFIYIDTEVDDPDSITYPIQKIRHDYTVFIDLWKDGQYLDSLLESVSKRVKERDDFVMMINEPKLAEQIFLPYDSDTSDEWLGYLKVVPIPEAEAKYVYLIFYTFAALKGDD